MPQPPIGHNPDTPWPQWPVVLKTTSSHEEGCTRRWSLASTRFIGKNGKVCGVEVEEVEWLPATDGNRPTMKSTGKKEVIEADMVLLVSSSPSNRSLQRTYSWQAMPPTAPASWYVPWPTDDEWQQR